MGEHGLATILHKPVASSQLLHPPTLMGSHTVPCVPVKKKGIFGGMVIGT